MKTRFVVGAILTLAVLAVPRMATAQFIYATNNGSLTITRYTGPGGDVIIPTRVQGLPVTGIRKSAFLGSELTSVLIPRSVTDIGDWAFARCYSLTEVAFPGTTITRIGEGVFYLCANLTSVAIPDSVITIDDWAFSGCANLQEVRLGRNLTTIDDWAFSHCFSLNSATIPDSVTRIGAKAFSSCYSLTNVTIGSGVTEIEEWAFSHCFRLVTVTIGERLKRLGNFAFFLCANLKAAYFTGDQPTFLSSGVFGGAKNAIIYHLPGTMGWGSTFDGLPTALWSLPRPRMLTFSSSFGVQSNGFGFTISSTNSATVVVEACASSDGSAWSPVATNTLSGGWVYFSDSEWKSRPMCFYRLRIQ